MKNPSLNLKLGTLFFLFQICLSSVSLAANEEGSSERMTRDEVVNVYSPAKPHARIGILKPRTRVKPVVSFAPRGFTEVLVEDEFSKTSRVLVRNQDLDDAEIEESEDADVNPLEPDHRPHPLKRRRHKIERPLSVGAGLSGYSSAIETRIQVSGDLRYLWNPSNETLFGVDLNFGSHASVGVRGGERYYFWPFSQLRPYVHAGIRVFDVRSWHSSAFDPGFGIQFIHTKGAFVELGANFLWARPFDPVRPNMWLFGGASGLRF